MKRKLSILLSAVMLFSVAATAQRNVPVEGAPGATLGKIVGTETLVTVVLKPSGAQDTNLRVVELSSETLGLLTSNNIRCAYRYDDIEKVIVQGGKVETAQFSLSDSRALSGDQKAVLDRAIEQARTIFNSSNKDQDLKIRAATILAGNRENDALEYLKSLADSNDLRTRYDAALSLYLVGEPISDDLIREGLASSSRTIRQKAALLAGLAGNDEATIRLSSMLQDRRADACAPAARALARLGDRSIIPALLNMIRELDERKGAAAVYALAELGGEDVIEQMKLGVRNADGLVWFRMALVLFKLGDPMGRDLLVKAFNDVPTLKMEAAQLLVREGDWDATQFLRDRLKRREDATFENLTARALNAAALYVSGDFTSKVVLQQLTQSEIPAIRTVLSLVIAEIGDRSLITVLQPLLVDEGEPGVTLAAATAATSLANPGFQRRLKAITDLTE